LREASRTTCRMRCARQDCSRQSPAGAGARGDCWPEASPWRSNRAPRTSVARPCSPEGASGWPWAGRVRARNWQRARSSCASSSAAPSPPRASFSP
jgi:hypothetical protein